MMRDAKASDIHLEADIKRLPTRTATAPPTAREFPIS